MNEDNKRLLDIVAMANSYCEVCENALEYTRDEFINRMLDLLPRIYWNFLDLSAGVALTDSDYFPEYVDEPIYDRIKNGIAATMGSGDSFLETFEEDMKYSDTPISSSVSECLADLYQPLFNFVSVVHDSEGAQMQDAFIYCKEEFENYWSQTLCNVLRALNNVKFSLREEEEI